MAGRGGHVAWVGLLALLAVVGALLLFVYEQRHTMPVCRAPNVALRELDARLTGIGCATLGAYGPHHGVWIDAAEGSWFHSDATAAPRGKLGRTDGWLFVDAPDRARIYAALPPIGSRERVRDQIVAIAFDGTEYRVDEPNAHGLKRFFDIGRIRDVRLLRRDFAGMDR